MFGLIIVWKLGFWYELCGSACENRLEFCWFRPGEQLSLEWKY